MNFRRLAVSLGVLLAITAIVAGCSEAAKGESRTIPLKTLNASGVTGTVLLTALDDRRTRIEIRVDPAGHPDMPSHIHPGTCTALVPQPKYPLQNVLDGHSITIITASFASLLGDGLAVNIHRSNADLATYTACAEIK